jgi:hypothetical protein
MAIPISLCMIVKNEEVFLDTALRSAKSVLDFDDMVVVDTGSTDRTKEIALDNGAKVFDFEWCDDFAAARNFAASKAKYDWIFVMDADEEAIEIDLASLEVFLKNDQALGMTPGFDLSSKTSRYGARIYNRTKYAYTGKIHEFLARTDGSSRTLTMKVASSFVHHGYLPEFDKVIGKLERNQRLLEKDLASNPNDPYLLYQLGKSFFCNDRDLHEACRYFSKALGIGVDIQLDYVYELVECYGYALINTGQYGKALELIGTFAEHYNKNARYRFLSAHVFQNNAMFIEAVEAYESCIGADEMDHTGITSYLSYYNIGVILECVEMIEDAIGMYENCGDYGPALERLEELRK